ncbi:hypothetical protein ACQ4WY_25750 [Janthinobacterium sp. LB2P49]|uniref:hypothetical protein n=1 Tax=Janthinobacterium sp. LB2P49 TaxID=3424198 RepID=UPI003F1EA90A
MKKYQLILVFYLGLHLQMSHAVSLAHRETDDSVCDLAPLTTYRLGLKPFVPAGTRDEAEIYFRLAVKFITNECKNKQTLLLHSEMGTSFDDGYFRKVGNQVCAATEIKREPAGTQEFPQGFILRCTISKLKEATAALAEMEKAKPTEAMIEEGAPMRSAQPNRREEEKKPCGDKMTWETVVLGWGGSCR